MRLFAAIPLPDAQVSQLELVAAGMQFARPVPARNYHITLGFFDEVPKSQAEDLHQALGDIHAARFDVELAGMGVFGGARPRQLHALLTDCPALTQLHLLVKSAARAAGIELERRKFVPHVTLGRGLTGEDAQLLLSRHAGFRSEPFFVDHFALFESRLHAKGPTYDALAEYPLA